MSLDTPSKMNYHSSSKVFSAFNRLVLVVFILRNYRAWSSTAWQTTTSALSPRLVLPHRVPFPSLTQYNHRHVLFGVSSANIDRTDVVYQEKMESDCTSNQCDKPVCQLGDLTQAADAVLRARGLSVGHSTDSTQPSLDSYLVSSSAMKSSVMDSTAANRRLFLASTLIASGTFLTASETKAANLVTDMIDDPMTSLSPSPGSFAGTSKLQKWEITPVNKRTGVTVFDVEKDGYNVRFVTYLSRFLLCFDAACQKWWTSRASDIPRTATAEQVQQYRLAQFGAFSASVEVGLQEYRSSNDGPKKLLSALLKRYGPDPEELRQKREQEGLPPLSADAVARQDRTIKEARRQLALLFGLMEKNQPTDELTKLLASLDNGSVDIVKVIDPGSGYAPGYGSPQVTFPPPEAGSNYVTATGRALLRPNGKILRIDVVNRGDGYQKAPTVTISPPVAIRFAPPGVNTTDFARTAEAKAFLFRSGPNKGRIERIQLTDPGEGYTESEIIRVRVAPPDTSNQDGGVVATATAILEYEVSEIIITNNGTGYAVEKPINVYVEPPPLTARVNMNDPMMARIISPNEPLPPTSIPSKEMRAKMPSPNDPSSVVARASFEARRGGGGGCIGRACYDRPVVAVAYTRAERDIFNSFRNEEDVQMLRGIELAALTSRELPRPRLVSGASSDSRPESFLSFQAGSLSSELLSLLPGGIGLQYNSEKGRYELAEDPNYQEAVPRVLKESLRIDPDFGPRGRSPIEREMQLGVGTFLRFVASGAICCSGVHLALTPIDVVKTKVQTNPEMYPGIVKGFQRILAEGGAAAFFTGWLPTFFGFLAWGGVSYALTEYFRRALVAFAGSSIQGLDVAIILFASAAAAFAGSFVIAPFEAVRIRSVFDQTYAPNIFGVYNRMVNEEGFLSLFSAVPVTLAKEIPFAMAKFTVFDISTNYFYSLFPAAREDVQLSLVVSLIGGVMGGLVAAIVSNPADVTISQMKKSKSSVGALATATAIIEGGGVSALFRGLPLRLLFYMLLVSLQFLIYDAVRIALGVGVDDLKLYLDVLGGALSAGDGPA